MLTHESYRDQVRALLAHSDHWRALPGIADGLSDVVQAGHDAAAGGHWREAEKAFWAVCRGVLERLLETHDEGDLREQVALAAGGLAGCLAEVSGEARARVLKRLLRIVAWDIEEGGGLGFTEAVLSGLKTVLAPEERTLVLSFVDRHLRRPHSGWARTAWAEFALATHPERTDDELLLAWLDERGLDQGLFLRRLEMGQGQAALEIASERLCESDWGRLQACERLERAGFASLARSLASQGVSKARDHRLLDFLADRVEPTEAWRLRLRRWELRQDLEAYQALRDLEHPDWQSVKQRLLGELTASRGHELRVEIHVLEQEWTEAWSAAEQAGPHTRLKLAERSEQIRPAQAGEAFLESARQLIALRGRDRYARAAELLSRGAPLLGAERWSQALREIRSEAARLPALREELRRAGL
ncbi:MAG: hypothetical protein AB1758_26260 [Candidatus Eremiobacterota bacterium]